MVTLCYNVAMALVDAAALGATLWGRRKGFDPKRLRRTARIALVLAALPLVGLARFWGEDSFGVLRLLAYGVFLHGTILLAGASALLWKSSRRTAIAADVGAALLVLIAADAFLVEPTWLEVSRVTLTSPKLKQRLKIVVMADIQTDHVGEYEREVFSRAMAEKPDLILLAGDYLQEADEVKMAALREDLRALLRDVDFRAPLGIFAVRGNMEGPCWTSLFDDLPVTAVDETRTIERGGLRVTCLSLRDAGRLDLSIPASDDFHIVVGHYPDYALGGVKADLLIAGHTHGGQVQLPLFGPIFTLSEVPRAWAGGGPVDLGGGRTLVVSRGIGMERHHAPRLRFLCRPELVVIDLQPSQR